MKTILMISLASGISLAACNNKAKKETVGNSSDTTSQVNTNTPDSSVSNTNGPINEIIHHYLQIKNALANDDGAGAATAGNHLAENIGKIDKSTFSSEQQKTYDSVSDDIKENAEHIGSNAGKIDHQREHFEMLSKDIYDLLKVFKANQTYYQDFCPMANDGKGAYWVSESKEIKNPYMGKKMPICGEIKEEIK